MGVIILCINLIRLVVRRSRMLSNQSWFQPSATSRYSIFFRSTRQFYWHFMSLYRCHLVLPLEQVHRSNIGAEGEVRFDWSHGDWHGFDPGMCHWCEEQSFRIIYFCRTVSVFIVGNDYRVWLRLDVVVCVGFLYGFPLFSHLLFILCFFHSFLCQNVMPQRGMTSEPMLSSPTDILNG